MSMFAIDCLRFTRGFSRIAASLVVATALLVHVNDAMAQNQGQGQGQGQNQQPALTGNQASVIVPAGQTSVTLVVNGTSQTFNAGDVIDLSQNISVPATATEAFALGNGTTVAPAGGASFSVASSGNTVTVNLDSGSATASAASPNDNVTIANGNGIAISGTDVTSSYDPVSQETTVEVNNGTATLSGSATNGTKTVTANETLNASDTTRKVFKVAFADGTGVSNTNTGFVAVASQGQGNPQTPNVPNLPTVPVTIPQLANLLPTFISAIVPPAQVDSSSPGAP